MIFTPLRHLRRCRHYALMMFAYAIVISLRCHADADFRY